jgi:hypothetical protein
MQSFQENCLLIFHALKPLVSLIGRLLLLVLFFVAQQF